MGTSFSTDRTRCCGLTLGGSSKNGMMTAVVVLVPSWSDSAAEAQQFSGPDVEVVSRGPDEKTLPSVRINLMHVVDFHGMMKEGEEVEVQIMNDAGDASKVVATATAKLDAPLPASCDAISSTGHCKVDLDFNSLDTLYQGTLTFAYRVHRGADV